MPFTLDQFARLRPYVYHLTAAANVPWIASDGRIHAASHWLVAAGQHDLLRTKRREIVKVMAGERQVLLRDQFPLYAGKMSLEDGMTFETFIELLNQRVYFWPGDATGPNGYGQRHFDRYRDERPIVIRAETAELFALNSQVSPEFCRYNSGSPRPSNGIRSPRGRSTFVEGPKATYSAGKVVELTFRRLVTLPESTMVSPLGPWQWDRLSTFSP